MIKSMIKIRLAERDMSQMELAKRTGIRQPTISALCLNQAKHIPIDVLEKICKELNCQPGDLFVYIEEK